MFHCGLPLNWIRRANKFSCGEIVKNMKVNR